MNSLNEDYADYYLAQVESKLDLTSTSCQQSNTTDTTKVTDAESVDAELRKEEVNRSRKPHRLRSGNRQTSLLSHQQILALQQLQQRGTREP